jgi:nucleotide-binding universal stress UspA family protein
MGEKAAGILEAKMDRAVFVPGGEAGQSGGEPILFKIVLVPLDGSPKAEQILMHVKALQRAFHSEVILLRVVAPAPSLLGRSEILLLSRPDPADREAERAEAYLNALRIRLGAGFRPVRTLCLAGDPAACILRAAERVQADLIAMAIGAGAGLARRWSAGVAGAVLMRAEMPVLLVPSPG